MRRVITAVIIVIACCLVQTAVFRRLSIASITPNLMLIAVSAFGFLRGKKEGLLVGFFAGLLLDLCGSGVIGFYALIYMYVGFLNGLFRRKVYPDSVILPMLLIALSDFCLSLFIYGIYFVFRLRFHFSFYMLSIILPELIFTMLATIVLYPLILKINGRLEAREKIKEKKFV